MFHENIEKLTRISSLPSEKWTNFIGALNPETMFQVGARHALVL